MPTTQTTSYKDGVRTDTFTDTLNNQSVSISTDLTNEGRATSIKLDNGLGAGNALHSTVTLSTDSSSFTVGPVQIGVSSSGASVGLNLGVAKFSNSQNEGGGYTHSVTLGGMVKYSTTTDSTGNVVETRVTIGTSVGYWAFGTRGEDRNTFYTETKIPGQPLITTEKNLTNPNDLANTWVGRLVNWLTGGLVDTLLDHNNKLVDVATNLHFTNAQKFVPRRDPLTFDLDGDGIETVAASVSNPILFDHDGDGIKNGTGWVNSDDAFLVLDKNANGTIDNGNELFGDNTIKSNGQKAADGFDALADLDSNHDGVVNAQDSQFANLKLWRDLNQDGISQSNELFTLGSLNIAGINVASTEHSQVLANGNELADKGTFIKADGSTGSFGEVTGNIGDVNLADDTFNREFPDHLDTSGLPSLPNMQGSGKVRDLLEAATQSSRLQSLLQDFSAAGTRAGQMAIIDSLLDAWADTSGMAESLDDRLVGLMHEAWTIDAQGNPVRNPNGDLPYHVIYQAFGNQQRSYITQPINSWGGSGSGGGSMGGTLVPEKDLENDNLTEQYKALIANWQQKIHILEAFNGSYFFGLPSTPQPEGAKSGLSFAAANGSQSGSSGTIATSLQISVSYTQQQLDFLNNSYTYLKESIFEALALQTRLKPVLDLISINFNTTGLSLNFTDVNQYFQNKIAQDVTSGIADLLEFNQFTSSFLTNQGWTGNQVAADYIRNATLTPELQEILNTYRVQLTLLPSSYGSDRDDVIIGNQSNDTIFGESGRDRLLGGNGNDILHGGVDNDALYGEAGNDALNGGAGDDYLEGGDGNDTLKGDEGTDVILGGAGDDIIYGHFDHSYHATLATTADDITGGLGNDTIYGTGGANIYRYNLGDGTDTIEASGKSDSYYQNATATLDTLVLGSGIARTDVSFTKNGNDFVINFTNPGDKITLRNWYSDAASRLVSIQFGDGSSMSAEDFIKLQGTNLNDSITGSSGVDHIYGLAGNDALNGGAGDDYLEGGDGNDTLKGDEGTDVILGGAGDDIIYGHFDHSYHATLATTADDITGGLGNDTIYGTGGANIYRYNLGDGTDTIEASGKSDSYYQNATATLDTLVLGSGIARTDVSFTKNGNDFVINFTNPGDKITLRNWYSDAASRLVSIQFGDGSSMSAEDFIKLQGTNLNDSITGSSGVDHIYGLAGNDALNGGAGDDYLEGGDGNDTLKGDEGTDVILGGAGDDIIYGHFDHSYHATLAITADDITGGLGNDTIYGTGGANIYRYNLGDGTDTIEASGKSDSYYQNATATLDTLVLGAGILPSDVTFSKNGNDFILHFNNPGDQIIFTNWYVYAASRLAKIQFSDGSILTTADLSALKGTIGNDNVIGTIGNDLMYGLGGDDVLSGQAGDDYIEGGDGNDTLKGDEGTDIILGGAGNDIIYGHFNHSHHATLATTADDITGGLGNDTIYGTGGANIYRYNLGDGTDTIEASGQSDGYYQNATGISDILVLGAGIAKADLSFSKSGNDFVINFTNLGDKITFRNWYAFEASRLAAIQFADGSTIGAADFLTIRGTEASDSIYGSSGNDIIYGLGGNDTIYGQVGDDTLYGGDGADNLHGQAGNDVIIGGAGNDTIYADTSSTTTSATTDDITGGLGNDTIYGTVGANIYRYTLGDGTDTVEASGFQGYTAPTGATLDTLILGAGISRSDVSFSKVGNNFVINFTNAGDKITFNNWYSYAASRLASIQFADGSTMEAADFVTLRGTEANDYIDASVGNDIVYGLGGNDTIYGQAGDDTLYGGDGADNLHGQAGNDVIIGGAGNDTIYADTSSTTTSATTDDITGGLGNDTIYGTVGANIYRYTLGDGTDTVEASGFQGYTAPTGATLDTLILGAGISRSDVSFSKVGNNFVINFTNAGDKITFNNWYSYAASRLASIQFADGSTMEAADFVTLRGTEANDYIDASVGNDIVYGLGGNDTIYGQAGDDTLYGGDGADNLHGQAGNDVIIGGAGNDTIYADTSSTTTSATTDDITGGLGNDTIYGTVGANIYRYTLGDGTDTVEASGFQGYTAPTGATLDTLILGAGISRSDVSFSKVGNNFEINFTNAGDKITFNNWYLYAASRLASIQFASGESFAFSETNTGTGSNNILGAVTSAAETMAGGLGDDVYIIDNLADAVAENAGEGSDSAFSSVTYTLPINVERLALIGASSINATGNELTNFLIGNTAGNILNDTAGGNDILQGLGGNDTLNDTSGTNLLDGGIGADVITAGSGNDLIIGGKDNDTISTGTGSDVILFNKGDGADILNASVGSDNTLSLGGNFAYSDLSLTKSSSDLLIKMGASDQITLKGWYDTAANNKSVLNLQVIAESIQGFSLGGADTLRDNKVETFNFANLVAAFDTAGATANWQLTDARLAAHLSSGSDTTAIGGDIAYQYGKSGSLTGVGLLAAQSVINSSSVGQSAQAFNDASSWANEAIKLS